MSFKVTSARSLASAIGNSCFSDLPAKSETLETDIKRFFRHIGGANEYNTQQDLICNPLARFAHVDWKKRVQIFHSAASFFDGAPYFGLTSGDINGNTVGTILSSGEFKRYILTIASLKEVSDAGFEPLSNINLGQISKATNNTSDLSDFSSTISNGNDLPVFFFCPKLLPIPPGYTIPVGTRLSDDLPILRDGKEYFPAFVTWFHGMKYCVERNNGNPLIMKGEIMRVRAELVENVNGCIDEHFLSVCVENVPNDQPVFLFVKNDIEKSVEAKITFWENHPDFHRELVGKLCDKPRVDS